MSEEMADNKPQQKQQQLQQQTNTIAEDLALELPDMKVDIDMELNSQSDDDVVDNTEQATKATEVNAVNSKSSSLNELKRFPLIREHNETAATEVDCSAAKQLKLDKAVKKRKSIIEIHIQNDNTSKEKAKNNAYLLPGLSELKEQAIIDLAKIREQEKLQEQSDSKIEGKAKSNSKESDANNKEKNDIKDTRKENNKEINCGGEENAEVEIQEQRDNSEKVLKTEETNDENEENTEKSETKVNKCVEKKAQEELQKKVHVNNDRKSIEIGISDEEQNSATECNDMEVDVVRKNNEEANIKMEDTEGENNEKESDVRDNIEEEVIAEENTEKVSDAKGSIEEETDDEEKTREEINEGNIADRIIEEENIENNKGDINETNEDISLSENIEKESTKTESTESNVKENIANDISDNEKTYHVKDNIEEEDIKKGSAGKELAEEEKIQENINKKSCDKVENFIENPNILKSDAKEEANIEKSEKEPEQINSNDEATILQTDMPNEPTMHDDESSNLSTTAEYEQQQDQQPPEALTPEEEVRDRELRASCETFLQHLPCFKLQQNESTGSEQIIVVPKCRECRRRTNHSTQQASATSDVYCRFYEFRRLKYNEVGELLVAGFPNPYTDPTTDDMNIWKPDEHTDPTAGYMDIQVCRYILLHAGDQFCYIWRQEAEALKLHENPNTTIAWKKVVQGVREICDVCDTTLFNYHWTCDKCGFGVCADCFKDRKEKRTCRKTRDKPQRGRDEFHWLLCTASTTHQKHEMRELMLTQIIAGDALNVLGRLLHDVRTLWQIPQVCGCLLSKQTLPANSELSTFIQDLIKESQLKQQTSASSLATEETLRKQARMEQLHAKKLEFARAKGIDYVPGRVWTKQTLGKDPITTAFDNFKHINFLRKGLAGLRRFLPPRAMTLAHSTLLAPGVSHEWLCDGKLLRLTDAMHPDNRILYQEVWKCGQPVMISEVARSLNLDLWRPEAFCRDFGDKPNDLINCLNGNLVPNQPMRHFWEGFQHIQKRLLDSHGKPMLLKLKDWPPGDDFAEILPTRYNDLMKGLPMPEYTLRTGNLNIASCLPKMFVPPDLGPKMYNAYGSALHPDKGTTNLHLDISDAVNIMVYVGIPQDFDCKSQLAATQRAIAMGGCEYLTRARCQSPNVLPGALWHIFPARDADKIRDLLNRVTLEKGFRLEPDHDPIHDQNWYLDDKLRARLFKEYGVEGYPIVQCLGDAVFIPAGAPHQVQNLHNCIKVAEDFVSPENITHCYHLTHEFRRLSHSHTNHEDKLQIKNIIYHAIKDCCTILVRALHQRIDTELEAQQQQLQQQQPSTQVKFEKCANDDDDDDDNNELIANASSSEQQMEEGTVDVAALA